MNQFIRVGRVCRLYLSCSVGREGGDFVLHLQSPSGGFINHSCVYLVSCRIFYPFMIFLDGGLADQSKALRTARAESNWDVLGLLDAKRGGSTRPLLGHKSTSVVFPPFLLHSHLSLPRLRFSIWPLPLLSAELNPPHQSINPHQSPAQFRAINIL